jgi:hypothetical protein
VVLILAKLTKCSRGTVPAGPVTTIRLSEVNTVLKSFALTQVERSCSKVDNAKPANKEHALRINTDAGLIRAATPTGLVMMDGASVAHEASSKLNRMKDAVN